MAAIVCHQITRVFGAVRAVDGVDLQVGEGQFMALLGPSGCGKTTLLRLLAGFEIPDAGSISIDGQEVSRPGLVVPPEQRRIGMVFQDYALFPHLDVAANVQYGLPRRADRARRTQEMIDLVGLSGMEKRMPHQLSGGQQQRVALARALAPEPAAILLDEPFSNLDAGMRAQVRAEVREILRRAAATAVFVTHDQEEALSIADVVAVMRHGRMVQCASPQRLYFQPASHEIAAFVGEANFLPAQAHGTTAESPLGTLALQFPTHGPVELMLRPESLLLTPDADSPICVVNSVFYGHDQIVNLRHANGLTLQARLLSFAQFAPGERVHIHVEGPVHAFPDTSEPSRTTET